jgi:hypothetical protein
MLKISINFILLTTCNLTFSATMSGNNDDEARCSQCVEEEENAASQEYWKHFMSQPVPDQGNDGDEEMDDGTGGDETTAATDGNGTTSGGDGNATTDAGGERTNGSQPKRQRKERRRNTLGTLRFEIHAVDPVGDMP